MYLGIDIGGTKTLLAAFNEAGQLSQTVKFPTSHDYQQFLIDLKTQSAALGTTHFEAAAVGAAGRHDRTQGILVSCGNLSWKNVPLKQDLETMFGCRFVVDNDAKVGGLSEAILVADEFKNVLYIPVGTGIGVAYIANGVIDLNVGDSGGSQLIVEYDGRQQIWEDVASGKAIVAHYGKKASDITDPKAWQEIGHRLYVGILELLAIVNPDVIIIGGGVGAHFEHFADYLAAELGPGAPPLRQAQHAEEAVIYGCYELIKQAQDGKTAQ